METTININIKEMKETIKKMVEKQKSFKNQRRTNKIVGKREMPAWEASYKHALNREKLRIMYAAYGLARGKSFSVVENHYPEENHPLHEFEDKIKKIFKKYELEEVE